MKNYLKLSLVFVSLFAGLSCVNAGDYPFTSELTVSNFSVNKLSVPEQAKALNSAGATSMWARLHTHTIYQLKELQETPEVQSGDLSIGIVRLEMNAAWEYDEKKVKRLLSQVKELDLPLWVYVKGKGKDRAQAVELFKRFCTDAAEYDVDIVIYPHSQQIFHNALDSLELIEELGFDNLKLAVMWCHEFNSGVYLDIADTMEKVAPYLAIASISGADEKNFEQKYSNWQYAIMPLDRGNIDSKPFLDALAKHQFDGAILLKCWGIKDAASDHIPRSLAKWEEMIQSYAK